MISDIVMISLIPFLFFGIVLFHEFGHFVVARIFKVKIDELSLGFGKVIWSRNAMGKPSLVVRRYPILGHVSINHDSFEAMPFIKKALIMLGGPVFNVLLAFIVMFFAFFFIGQPSQPPVFTAVKIGQVAHSAGLQDGDRVLSINGDPVIRYEQVSRETKETPVEPIVLSIKREKEIFDVSITPFEDSYVDVRGIERSHGILGVIANHYPIGLDNITHIDGVEAEDKDHARELVIGSFDKKIVIGMDTADNREHDYETVIRSNNNQHLFDEDHKRYKRFYLGKVKDNFYKDLSLIESIVIAFKTSKKMFLDVAKLPLQIFPIDGTKLKYETIVYDDDIVIRNFIFRVAFFVGAISIVVGFINLIPLPHFDGGQLLLLFAQKCSSKTLTPKKRAIIIMVALMSLYLGVMAANFSKLPLYLNAKIETVSEWLEDR